MQPTDETDLAEAIAGAVGALRITGGGTRDVGRPVTGAALSVAGLTGVTLYEPGALTLVARAGTPIAEIENVLAAEGQRLAFEPLDMRGVLATSGTPTLGGVVATNASGARRVAVGAARDHVLGVRFVDGAGRIVKNGGRVMKNVTGYDLVKLLAGSWGTLGVLTEVSLKVLPRPETSMTLVLHGLDAGGAVAAMAAALGSPYDISGAAYRHGDTWLRIEGFAASVAYRAERLGSLLGGAQSRVEDTASEKLWRGAPIAGEGDIWRISVRPSDAPGLVARLPHPERATLDWGGGLIWAPVPDGTDLRAHLGPFAGHATLIRASAATRAALPVFPPEAAPIAALSAGLRSKFDPRGILNPGLMG